MNSRTYASKSRTVTGKPKTKAPGIKNQEQKPNIMTLSDLLKDEIEEGPIKPPKKGGKGVGGAGQGAGTKPASKKPISKGPGRHAPVKIGESRDPDKWKCKVCQLLNEDYEDVCRRCESERGETKDENKSFEEEGEEEF